MASVRRLWSTVFVLTMAASAAGAQVWRQTAREIGSTARVLIIGTRPEDEDNALIAWLSLGRHVETAYLSLTRGEASINVAGSERQAALGVLRTAEVLAERERDGAHQYFTRAYDFGSTKSDSLVNAAWPHEVLLKDVVAVVRAFRPHVVISLFSDSTERDATRRVAARVAREAFDLAGDTVRMSSGTTSRLPAWTVSRLFTRVDTGGVVIDVGEFDRIAGRSYAELGADVRRLQRTQPAASAPPMGHAFRFLRLDATRGEDSAADLFGGVDTTWARFRGALPAEAQLPLDSLQLALRGVRAGAASGAADSVALGLARVVKFAIDARLALPCSDVAGVPLCAGAQGDAAVSLTSVRVVATRALMGAANIAIDGTVARELVASRDTVPFAVTVRNAGALPLTLRRLEATSGTTLSILFRDTAVVLPPDSVGRWSGTLRILANSHWWQIQGLVPGTWMHRMDSTRAMPIPGLLLSGEDRIATSGVVATIAIGGVDVPLTQRQLVYRSAEMLRGDARHPVTGVTPVSVLFERAAEYERAGVPIDRLFHVYVSSVRSAPETLAVTLMRLPAGLRADSTTRVVILPPFGARNVFFRLRGTIKPGSDSIKAEARGLSKAVVAAAPGMKSFELGTYNYGAISRDYPHIPSQQFVRFSSERIEGVDPHMPPGMRIAYVKGTDDVQTPLGQLQINLQAIDPSLLSIVDLSVFNTILIGADALANDALVGAVPSLREYMRNGGTVVVLPAGEALAVSGLAPYPIAFDSLPKRLADPEAQVRPTGSASSLLNWPNKITSADFDDWVTERGRHVPAAFDPRYRTVLSVADGDQSPTAATILTAPVGKGMFIYTSLSLDRQLTAVHPGAARLFVNLLAAGRAPLTARK